MKRRDRTAPGCAASPTVGAAPAPEGVQALAGPHPAAPSAWRALAATLAVLALSATSPQAATTIWRCGDEAPSYTDRPCPGGRKLTPDDPPGPERISAARSIAERERTLADTLADERRSRERSATGRWPAGIRMRAPEPLREGPGKRASTHTEEDAHSSQDRKARRHAGSPDPRLSFQLKLPAPAAPRRDLRRAPAP